MLTDGSFTKNVFLQDCMWHSFVVQLMMGCECAELHTVRAAVPEVGLSNCSGLMGEDGQQIKAVPSNLQERYEGE